MVSTTSLLLDAVATDLAVLLRPRGGAGRTHCPLYEYLLTPTNMSRPCSERNGSGFLSDKSHMYKKHDNECATCG